MTESNWLCLQVASRQEWALANVLNSLHIPAYTPRYERLQQVFFQRKLVAQPLFPTYLFASLEYYNRRSAVKLLPTVMKSRVVGEIERGLLDEIEARQDESGLVVLSKDETRKTAKRPFKPKDALTYHAMGNFEAVFEAYTNDSERVIILATMFNQQCRIPVNIGDVALAV